MRTAGELVRMCVALCGGRAGLSLLERKFANEHAGPPPPKAELAAVRAAILDGADPLGEAFSAIRPAQLRREAGAVYTPRAIVESMTRWVEANGTPDRIVDPGAGSGRFILGAASAFPRAQLVAIETDPLAALMLRANLNAHGCMKRSEVIVNDYRRVELPTIKGATAFIGNPPYVRHHRITAEWKNWYAYNFGTLGIRASSLAGLHLHFFLQTFLMARRGDLGAFITSAEWLDVNYGSALRRLLLEHLGAVGLHVLEPTVEAFPGTATTAAITCFRIGSDQRSVKVRSVERLDGLNGLSKGKSIQRASLASAGRWSVIVRPPASMYTDSSGIEIGELFRVHRGQVTGSNSIWIAGEHARDLPDSVKLPTVTRAKDLISAGASLDSPEPLRQVIDLPQDLDCFDDDEARRVEAFLQWARAVGAHNSYIAQHRKAWWSVGLRAPAPILCTYMARRPPQFTMNRCGARHINVAHGLYPREDMPDAALGDVVRWLNANTSTSSGRTYAGGLTKFEPKEIERLRLPRELVT